MRMTFVDRPAQATVPALAASAAGTRSTARRPPRPVIPRRPGGYWRNPRSGPGLVPTVPPAGRRHAAIGDRGTSSFDTGRDESFIRPEGIVEPAWRDARPPATARRTDVRH